MKNIKILAVTLLLIFTISSCKDFYDVNDPTNIVPDSELNLKLMLPGVEYHTVMLQFSISYSIGQVQQHIASYFSQGIDQHYESSISSAWTRYYTKVLYQLNKMETLADEIDAVHYKGVINTLKALSLGMMTDLYGDMPYYEASTGSNNLTPAVDSQQTLYNEIQSLLDTAITQFNSNDNSGYEVIEGDSFYGGDLDKWEKLAYTLKARYALQTFKRNGTQAAQDALTYLQNGFTSNDDDLQLFFGDKIKNPWHTSVVLASNTGNISVLFSEQLVNYMNSSIYTTTDYDPRIYDYVDNGGAATFDGAQNGNEGKTEAGNNANTTFNANSYFFKKDSPIVLVSYAEDLFIKAEAEFIVNGGDATSTGSSQAAYDAYKTAIAANMDKIGIDASLRDAYLNDPAIDVSMASLKLEHIMKEKYIALLLNPVIFNDMRRYDFSTDVYKGLELPANQDPSMNGQWFRRVTYSLSEIEKNTNLLEAYQTRIVPVWWDE
jgi:hypothetical protein